MIRSILSLGFILALIQPFGAIPLHSSNHTVGSTITVNTTVDDISPNLNCTLREAILAANTDSPVDQCQAGSGVDTILLPYGWYQLSIVQEFEKEDFLVGDLDISSSLSIVGTGAQPSVIDARYALDRVIHITGSDSQVQLTNLVIQNGGDDDIDYGGGIYNEGKTTVSGSILQDNGYSLSMTGGAIYNTGELTIDGTTLLNNHAATGGGIYNQLGNLTIINSLVENNYARFAGGGLILHGGKATLTNTSIKNNTSKYGGGIWVWEGELDMTGSTIALNETTDAGGGGIGLAAGTLNITNSTISGNLSATDGAGLSLSGQASLKNVTITNNESQGGSAGGLYATGQVVIQDSLIAGNRDYDSSAPDCYGEPGKITSQGYNLVGIAEGCNWIVASGDKLGSADAPLDPLLGALSDHGGAAQTHALLQGSPAIDSGSVSACLSIDQRGVARPQGAACDMGAYEAIQVSVQDAQVTEGNFGSVEMVFNVSLSGPSQEEVSLDCITVGGSAQAGSDYRTYAYALTFPAGVVSQPVSIQIHGDMTRERDEIFSLSLGHPVNAIILNGEGAGTILNDDQVTRMFLPLAMR